MDPLTDAQQTMVREAVPYARWYARHHSSPNDRAEALSVCLKSLIDAVFKWDSTRGVTFVKYASRVMRNALADAYRTKVRVTAVLLHDVEAPEESCLERAMEWLRTRGLAYAARDQVDLAILELSFEGATLEVLARHTGYSPSGVMRRRRELFYHLRKLAESDGESFGEVPSRDRIIQIDDSHQLLPGQRFHTSQRGVPHR